MVMIRARMKADLRGLMKATKLRAPIIETPDADYPFRIIVRRSNLQLITHTLCSNQLLDYTNFKNCIYDQDPERANLYHEVWALLTRLEALGSHPLEGSSAPARRPANRATQPQRPR